MKICTTKIFMFFKDRNMEQILQFIKVNKLSQKLFLDDPSVVHSTSLVFINNPDNKMNLIELNRTATIIKKSCLIASYDEKKNCIRYNEIKRDQQRVKA